MQLEFLQRVSRILEQGRFTATYKFALLIALANLSITRGTDRHEAVTIPLDDIAREFMDLHWGMSRPFPGASGQVLRFTTRSGGQASVITDVGRHATTSRGTHARQMEYRRAEAKLMARVRRTLTRDVLYRLQSVGASAGSATPAMQFMYDHPPDAAGCARLECIVLKPGVSACFRALRPLIVALTQAKWASWMRYNNPSLGPDRTLEQFMFGSSRLPLVKFREWLFEMQGGRCFYTGTRLQEPSAGEVDHFLPWARYPLDLPANLVLASTKANSDKRDRIASERLLAPWVQRNSTLDPPKKLAALLQVDGGSKDSQSDRCGTNTTHAVARWLYALADQSGLSAWDGPNAMVPLTGVWRKVV